MKFTKNKILIILITGFLSFVAGATSAATLYFSPAKGDFSQSETLVVDLKINTENQSINTVEGYIKFSPEIFDLEKISDGSSIISFWVKKPESGAGSIAFSGVIPGGYLGQDGLLARIFLRPKKEGLGILEIESSSKVLLNDGLGTEAKLKFTSASFNIIKPGIAPLKPKNQIVPVITKDTEPPEAFSPQIARDLNIFDGKWFLVFATQDKGSGIDFYNVCEGDNEKCVIASSPYLLKNQALNKKIFVKAFDKAGNEKIALLQPTFVSWYKKPIVDIIIGAIILIVLLLVWRLWKKLHTKRHEY